MMSTKRVINMLSDTVTQPSAAMRRVIAAAKVGDDMYGADPTVKELQRVAAAKLGKEDAIYVPSGTMSNLIAVGTHCSRGDEVILGDKAHIFTYEGGGASAYMGVAMHTVPNQPDGTLELDAIAAAIRDDDQHYPRSQLIALEHTHNNCGGRVLPLPYIRQVERIAKENNLKFHIDGARLANASIASGIPMDEIVSGADSVSLCLSKGLGAPVGTILAGSNEFIARARRIRKSLGGGMRQAGLIAAAGLFALENQFERLAEDHANAKLLAQGLSEIPGINIDPNVVDTNILFFELLPESRVKAKTLMQRLEAEKGILMGGAYIKGERLRAVTNLHITREDVEYTVDSIRDLVATAEEEPAHEAFL